MKNKFRLLFVSVVFLLTDCTEIKTSGKVVGISDGDTFTVLSADNHEIRVRLFGIDAPESNQPFGKAAKRFLSDMVHSRYVTITEMDHDQYGRVVGIVTVDTVIVNEALLNEGMAWHYDRYDDNPHWAALEQAAQEQRKGLWSEDDPVPPWRFRRQKKHAVH